MREQDVLRAVSDGLSGLDLAKPAEEIIAEGTSRRRRRMATATVAAVALAAGLAVGVPALMSPKPATSPTAQRPTSAAPVPASLPPTQLVGFTVVSNPNGTVTLTLSDKQLADPGEVRRALAEAGVPAEVRVESHCYSLPSPPGLDKVFLPSASAALVIKPSAIPKGAVVSIGYHDPATNGPIKFGLAWKDRLVCNKN
ncbi:hypothetical protein [Micromonospora vulcania]|uniref:Uncharacterized protein n=1 Tax=Micromonospora vulcania TaxID=1441873 RepID=A0ABW1HAD2_9ACTN